MSGYLIDTNVFSRIFAGDADVKNLVERQESVIDGTIYIECLQGSKSNAEKKLIKTYIDNFSLFHFLLISVGEQLG
jgi:predicted nucleic acid-binding protein